MSNFGIISQYGFLYQRYRYINCLIKELNSYDYLIFEGTDDIEENLNEGSLFSINNSSVQIQVKTGIIDRGTCYKIFGNWLKVDNQDCIFRLYCERKPTISFDDDFINDFIEEIKKSASCNNSKILKQVYTKFYGNTETDDNEIKNVIQKIIQNFKIDEKNFSDLFKETSEFYKNNFTSHIKIYDELKEKCFLTFVSQINEKIDTNLLNRRLTKLSSTDVNGIIVNIVTELNDKKFNIDIEEFFVKAQGKAMDIINNSNPREVQQLRFISNDDKFIMKHIINKLFYDEFRKCFNKSISIKNIEFSAFQNYKNTLDELPKEEKTPPIIFKKTIAIPIVDELLPKNEMYYKGCYIFLTSDNAPANKMISWKVYDE